MTLKKNTNNKMIAGVCSGIAEKYNIDTIMVRAGFAVAGLMGFGLPIILYVVLAVVMPTE